MSLKNVKKPSLISPDLTGLWETAYINDNKSNNHWYSKTSLLANFCMFLLLFSWMFGYIFVLIGIILFYYKYYMISIPLLSGLLLPFLPILKPSRNPNVALFLMNAANYFEGGCSWSFEYKREPNTSKTSDLSLNLNGQLYSYHPHGVFTIGFLFNGGLRMSAATPLPNDNEYLTDALKSRLLGLKIGDVPRHGMAAEALMWAPIFKTLIIDLCGCIAPAKKSSFLNYMKNNISFGVTPGGFYEIGYFQYGKDIAFIKEKKGFIKYALKYGYNVYPAYTFGECNTYKTFNIFGTGKLMKFMSKMHIPSTLFYGECGLIFPLMPFKKNVGIHTIITNPIKCPKIENPTINDINKYHEMYLNALVALYNRNKWRFGMENTKLISFSTFKVLIMEETLAKKAWIQSFSEDTDGKVKIQFVNGNEYYGEYKDDKICGNGKYIWNDGTVFEGEFKDNMPFGNGIYMNKDKTVQYNGNVCYGVRNGFGIMEINQPKYYRKYVGCFVNGKRHGDGILYYNKENTMYYKGSWLDGQRHGDNGTIIYENGNKYVGQWVNDKKCGSGTMYWYDKNEKYMGNWKNNQPNGDGYYFYGTNKVNVTVDDMDEKELKSINYYMGNFVNGLRQGYGVYYYANNEIYEGQWHNNLKHGKAKYKDSNGIINEFEFKHDYQCV